MIHSIAADPVALAERFRRIFETLLKAIPPERQFLEHNDAENYDYGLMAFTSKDLEGTPLEGLSELCDSINGVRPMQQWVHQLVHQVQSMPCDQGHKSLISALALALHIGYSAAIEQQADVADLDRWAEKQGMYVPRTECEQCGSRELYPTPGKGNQVDCGKCGRLQAARVMLT